MAIFNFFKTPNIRQFNYKPRYYDPEKDEYEQRKQRILQEMAEKKGESEYKPKLRKGFLSEKRNTTTSKRSEQISKYLIYVVILVALIYFVVL